MAEIETAFPEKDEEASTNDLNDNHDNNNTVAMTFEEKVQLEMENSKGMKISELKMKLMAKGVLTSTFCEKEEFVRAYAEVVVKEASEPKLGDAFAVENGDETEEDEEDGDEMLEEMPLCVRQRVDKLKEINDQREEIMKQYLAERAKLETKYQQLAKPLYKKRKDIVLGELDEEISKAQKPEQQKTENSDGIRGIPNFWVVTLSRMPVTAELVTEHDVDCLACLEDITCTDYENGEGFKLEFHFAPNDYFENSVLIKSYDVPNLLLADEPILKNVEGCEIKWKTGRSLTHVEVTKQQRGKGKYSGQIRTIKKTERSESFFHFFTPPKMPSLDTMDEQEATRLEAEFDEDYDIAQAFRSHIIPKAVMWFAGDAMEKEMEAAMAGMEWPPGANATPSGDENPECKQS